MKCVYVLLLALLLAGCEEKPLTMEPPFPPPKADAGPAFNDVYDPFHQGKIVWEYKTLVLSRPTHDAHGPNALATNEWESRDDAFNALGNLGWELVSSWVELETSFPYVENKQMTSVRPARTVHIFKRRVQ